MLENLLQYLFAETPEPEWHERRRRLKQLREGFDAPITAEIEKLIEELEKRYADQNS